MIKDLGSPSLARRMLVSLACTGIDLRPALRRTRDAILRPIRHELVAARTAWREELGDKARALQVKIQEEANARQTLFSDLRADVANCSDLTSRKFDARVAEIAAVRTVMDWIEHATVAAGQLISVVLPTRDRCDLLPRAIASVMNQTYANWELIIIDDASVDETPALLTGFEDPRMRSYRADGRGVCAARNAGLAQAKGNIIAYLDDDNFMHPGWLKSVTWGFLQRPTATVLYGAYIVDDPARIDQTGRGELPRLYFSPYDHYSVATHNVADIGCIAHRAGLVEARFDESLREMGDWDLFLRLTREAPPLALPAIACFYTTDAPNRLTHGPTHAADLAAIRTKNRR
jgi:hypothetical protein